MDTVMSNQLGKMTNAQFEELQTQITQVILKKEETALVYTYRGYHTKRIINHQAKQAINKITNLKDIICNTSEEKSEWNQIQETPPTTIVTVVTKKNTVTQKDTENGMRNHASLVENYYQEGVTGTTYQAE
ncbi:hypothetical protein G9A89_007053 [Geosiphon pyriformis]|nr:hypothetical protein G9A89_007053 [Geosiphon pyriformis]